ncbi:MAG: SCP2 sterol-binding domain-containing protein [Spirochaetes bacterium]|nr:SCP2 sterol-binding domain-containing protein [Spirochaetota bacterium]
MSFQLIKAHLNLYAVLQNLEDLVKYDREMSNLARDWDVSIQFSVIGGPKSHVVFKNGTCTVGRGKCKSPSVVLLFTSPEHLNKMFDNKANPIPVKGFTRLGFLTKEFPKLTKKMEYYLKPTDELLKDQSYLEMNTRLTVNTAAFALRELALLDPVGMLALPHIGKGIVQMKVMPAGPGVYIDFKDDDITVTKGDAARPMALMGMRGLKIANAFLNGKMDTFTAVASGDVMIKGQMPMLDSMSLILDRVPVYLS